MGRTRRERRCRAQGVNAVALLLVLPFFACEDRRGGNPDRDAHAERDGGVDPDAPAFAHCGVAPEHTEHACLHAYHGPFVALAAGGALTARHTMYELTVDAQGMGVVSLRADRGGLWSFFVNPHADVHAHDGFGTPVPWLLTDTRTGCDRLARVLLVRLEAGAELSLAVAAEPGATVSLLPERLGSDWSDALGGAPCSFDTDAALGIADAAARSDGGAGLTTDAAPDPGTDASGQRDDGGGEIMCRTSGPCVSDEECCEFCHDRDHCH